MFFKSSYQATTPSFFSTLLSSISLRTGHIFYDHAKKFTRSKIGDSRVETFSFLYTFRLMAISWKICSSMRLVRRSRILKSRVLGNHTFCGSVKPTEDLCWRWK